MKIKTFTFLFFSLISLCGFSQKKIPLVYNKENMGSKFSRIEMPSLSELKDIKELPTPYTFTNKKKSIKKFKQWEKRRSEIIQQLENYEIGYLPTPTKDSIDASLTNDTLNVTIHNNGE